LYCSADLQQTFEQFKDTYDKDELDAIEEAVFNSDPKLHVDPTDPANPVSRLQV
jgi:hypothetical protein